MTERLQFASAGMVPPFTLKSLRDAAEIGAEHLNQEDVDYANSLLLQGHTRSQARHYANGWAAEYARVALCEAAAARDFERTAYGWWHDR
jgi:hypothetical protein